MEDDAFQLATATPPRPCNRNANKQSTAVATMPPPLIPRLPSSPPDHHARCCAPGRRGGRHLDHGALLPACKDDEARCHPWVSGRRLPGVRPSFACGRRRHRAGGAVAPVANGNTSAATAGCTCKLCGNNSILDAVTPLYSLFVGGGGGDDVGAMTTAAAGVAAMDDNVPQTMTPAANNGPHPHLHHVTTACRG